MKTPPKSNPLAEGFRIGVMPPPEQFDNVAESESVTMTSAPDIQGLAARWRCSPATIRRMIAKDIDVTNPAAVGIYLLSIKNPCESTLESILDELEFSHENELSY